MDDFKDKIADALPLKRRHLIFYCLNLGLICPMLLSCESRSGLIFSLVLLVLMLLGSVMIADKDTSWLKWFPAILAGDVCIWLAVNQALLLDDEKTAVFSILFRSPDVWALTLCLAGLVLFLWACRNKKSIRWPRTPGLVLVAAGLVWLSAAGDLPLSNFLYEEPELALRCCLCCGGLWLTACITSELIDGDQNFFNTCLSAGLLCALIYLILLEQPLLVEAMEAIGGWSPRKLSWAWLLVALVTLGAYTAICWKFEGKAKDSMGTDSMLLEAVALGLVLGKLLPLGYDWVLLVYLLGCWCCVMNEEYSFKTLRLPSWAFLPALAGVLYVSARWLSQGLLLNLLIVGGYGICAYLRRKKSWDLGVGTLAVIALCAVAYAVLNAFHLDAVWTIAVIFGIMAGALKILDRPQKHRARCRMAVCLLTAILCGLAAAQGGSSIQVVTNFERDDRSFQENILPQIPPEAVYYNGRSYCIYNIDTCDNVTNWNQLQSFCAARGGYPAVISSMSENRFLFDHMTQRKVGGVYFGLSDEGTEGKWRWTNGASSRFTNWHPGEPNAENETEDYAMFFHEFTDGTWNDGSFDKQKGGQAFLCQWDGCSAAYASNFQNGNPSARITITARDREGYIRSARCQWYTLGGKPVGYETTISPYGEDLAILGEVLRITTVDDRGYQTIKFVLFLEDMYLD